MPRGFRPALPLTGGSDPGDYVRGVMSGHRLTRTARRLLIDLLTDCLSAEVNSVKLYGSHYCDVRFTLLRYVYKSTTRRRTSNISSTCDNNLSAE